jgi:hypothetical protein
MSETYNSDSQSEIYGAPPKILDVSLVILPRAALAVKDGLSRSHFVSIRPRFRSEALFPASMHRTHLKVAVILLLIAYENYTEKDFFASHVKHAECPIGSSRKIQVRYARVPIGKRDRIGGTISEVKYFVLLQPYKSLQTLAWKSCREKHPSHQNDVFLGNFCFIYEKKIRRRGGAVIIELFHAVDGNI